MGLPSASGNRRRRPPLDPCCDYRVFETARSASRRLWPAVRRNLQAWKAGILEQHVRHDRRTGRSRLVVKLHPVKGARVARAVLGMRLTAEIAIYVYHRHPALTGRSREPRPPAAPAAAPDGRNQPSQRRGE